MPTTSRIVIDVTTDENQVPVAMEWTAEDGGVMNQPASAMALSMWNAKEFAAMRMDRWTKEMSVEEMRSFCGSNHHDPGRHLRALHLRQRPCERAPWIHRKSSPSALA